MLLWPDCCLVFVLRFYPESVMMAVVMRKMTGHGVGAVAGMPIGAAAGQETGKETTPCLGKPFSSSSNFFFPSFFFFFFFFFVFF